MAGNIYKHLLRLKSQNKSAFSVLVDPDKTSPEEMVKLADLCNRAAVDYLLVGGSLLTNYRVEQCINGFRNESGIPIILFPGSPAQVTPLADGLLYLSLISGRNPELLIGQHVISAPLVRASRLEVLSTGYILIDGGVATTVSYISNTTPIPADKHDIALCTAWAGEMQGNHLIYLDAGSGAVKPVKKELVSKISSQIALPLIVGGGIRTAEKVYENCQAGANLIVVGNIIEKEPRLILEMATAVAESNK